MKLIFLKASISLTKTYVKQKDGTLEKYPYPNAYEFTSIEEPCTDIKRLEQLIRKHAALGHCMLKGSIAKPLMNESRKGSTDSNAATDWIVLDLDGIPNLTTVSAFLKELGLDDISYVIQYSASYGIENKDLRAHVFMQLSKPMAAPLLKQWLIGINHQVATLRNAMSLTKTGNALSWPLDITACQNDKLIYIASPVLKGGIKDPMNNKSRITFVAGKNATLTIPSTIASTEANRALTHARIDDLRKATGLPSRKYVYKMVGANQVLTKPDSATISEMKTDRGYVYFNLNGGDSWAYYHPENNPDFIYNFKGEPTYVTKELLPEYWEELTQQSVKISSSGLMYLTFLDRKTSVYYRGTYDPGLDLLDLVPAKNETQIRHFAKQYGIPLGDFIPEWSMIFDPQSRIRVDQTTKTINTYEPTIYGKAKAKKVMHIPPMITRTISHALNDDAEIFDHFINWLACIFQYKVRTKTAWILHGVEGCLAGDTVLDFNRGTRRGGRPLTVKDAFAKTQGTYKLGTGKGKTWQPGIVTRTKSVKDGMTIGFHEIYRIVEAGEKQLYALTTNTGRSIRVSMLHPFMRPDGSFTNLHDLQPGDEVVVEGDHNDHIAEPRGRLPRHTTYSIPHHPYAWKQIVGGKDYKRMHTARLVVEADMNNMSLDEFISIIRNDAARAAQLLYLSVDEIVHHADENPLNDALSNLKVIDKLNHDQHHAKSVGLGMISTKIETVASIIADGIEMTYDLTMKAPYQNYIANGFAVHNTGKGAMMHKIIRPLLGLNQTSVRPMEDLNEKYNDFLLNKFVTFIDEIEAKALNNEKGVGARLRNWITEPTIAIRAMWTGSGEYDNRTNLIFASNKPEPVVLTLNDRRHNVARFQPNKLQLSEADLDQIETELQAFHDYLMAYKADKALSGQVIDTQDRQTMISISETSVDVAVNNVINGNMEFFIDQLPSDDTYKRNALRANKVEDYKEVLLTILARTNPQTGACHISRDELHVMFDYTVGNVPETANKFTSMLKHHRIHMTKVWIDSRALQGITTTWSEPKRITEFSTLISPLPVTPVKLKAVGGKTTK